MFILLFKNIKSKIVKIELISISTLIITDFTANYINCIFPISTTSRTKKWYGKISSHNRQLSLIVGFNWVDDHKVFKINRYTIRSRCDFILFILLIRERIDLINRNSTNKADVPFIDLNNLWFLKLIALIIFCDLKEQVFEAGFQGTIMIEQCIVWISFFKFIQTIWHRSYICADYFFNRYLLNTCIVFKALLTITDVTFNAIIRFLATNPIFVHSWKALVFILRTFASPSKWNWLAFKKRMGMDIALSFIWLNLFIWILRHFDTHCYITFLFFLYSFI